MSDIGKSIRAKREELHMTQEELAKLLGYKNKTTITKIENGTNDIVQSKVVEFAKALNTTIPYLMGWENDAETSDDWQPQLTKKDERDIANMLEQTLSELENSQDALMFSGEPLDEETRELLKISLENSIRVAKIAAKKKYTPKKYRK